MDEEIKKLIKSIMIWHHKCIGIGLIFWGIWYYLCNVGIVAKEFYWPVILIIIGILCLVEIESLWRKL
ncbi:MAG: hypothetical protein QME57_04955 [Patescibacteria group bacterium]|nr:hypothetical protein [Patescibacteria group bacterium]